ncbi:MAG: hypothetical protein LUC97_12420 [Clostridiales bacterium]|nr:hypothetical protein [Clostridiales bacterium]
MTRQEIIIKLAAKSEKCVVGAINKLERNMGNKRFKETFKTINCNNGCENLGFEETEPSIYDNAKRTKIYYAHRELERHRAA